MRWRKGGPAFLYRWLDVRVSAQHELERIIELLGTPEHDELQIVPDGAKRYSAPATHPEPHPLTTLGRSQKPPTAESLPPAPTRFSAPLGQCG